MSLSQQALGGVLWATVEKFGGRVLNVLSTIILARILVPEDFGVVAMVAIFFSVANILIDSGFSQALIREDEISEDDKSTTFFINLITALILFIVLWMGAPAISRFFDEPVLLEMTRFMALTPIFFSITIVQRALYSQKINFRTQAIINLISTFLSSGSAITLAFYGFGVWALATQYVLMAFTTSFLFWGLNPWLPNKFFSKDSFNRLYGFGSKLMLSGLMDVFFKEIYKVIIGRIYNTSLLGFYVQAENFRNVVTENLVGILVRVTYPALSKVKGNPDRLKDGYKKILGVISLMIFPAMIGLMIVAEPLVITLIGEKWVKTAPILQLLSLVGLIYHMHVINLNILKVLGRTDLILKLQILKKTGVTIAIVIGLLWGFWGLIIAQVVSSYLALYLNMMYTSKLMNYKKMEQFMDVFPIVRFSIPMAIAVLGINLIGFDFEYVRLIVSIITGVIIYTATCYWMKAQPFKDMVYILRPKFPIFNKIKI
ncbi:lipopolysaccharide biosynthesis protein [Gracilimonas tropica]|uniref:lipopolysaccharide biosynthesis protein n=1 Tax=Gracilimonas tropica TaxID=454600 RepID=UPI00036D0989|nr:lipopolysaccharide biosynthesis protein [Gracilimonas tropica]